MYKSAKAFQCVYFPFQKTSTDLVVVVVLPLGLLSKATNHPTMQGLLYFSLKHHQKQADYHHFDTVFKTKKKDINNIYIQQTQTYSKAGFFALLQC